MLCQIDLFEEALETRIVHEVVEHWLSIVLRKYAAMCLGRPSQPLKSLIGVAQCVVNNADPRCWNILRGRPRFEALKNPLRILHSTRCCVNPSQSGLRFGKIWREVGRRFDLTLSLFN